MFRYLFTTHSETLILMLYLKTLTAIIFTFVLFNTNTFAQTLLSPANTDTDVSLTPQLQWTNTSGNSTVEIFDCNNQMSSINLGDYQLVHSTTINTIPDDLSGITYNQQTNKLYMVTNKSESVYETDLNGNIQRIINLQSGSNSLFYDTEDIVHISGNRYAVVEERKGTVALIDIFSGTTNINYSAADIIQMPGTWSASDNTGLEGISYNPVTGQFYVVEEKMNKTLSVFNMPTSFPSTLPPSGASSPCNLESAAFAFSDVSAIHHVGLTSGFSDANVIDNFLILSDEGQVLVETDANCDIISSLSLPISSPEGVTMDNDGNIYIVAEPNELYVFSNPNPPSSSVIHSATVSGKSYTVPNNILQYNSEYCWHVKNNGNTSTTFSFETEGDGSVTVCVSISTGADDIEEWQDGSMYTNSTDIELIYDSNPARLKQKIGLRFNELGIPNASGIVSSDIQFTADEVSTGTVNLNIRGEATGDASAYTTATGNLSSRATTSASAAWSPSNWNLVGERGTKQRTPDLSTIIQEIVDRPDFNENSSMAFIISGTNTNKRIAEAYEGSPAGAAELCITYIPAQPGPGLCIEPVLDILMEGAYDPSTSQMSTGLQDNYILPGQNIGTGNPSPSGQPYYQAPWNYLGTEGQGWSNTDYSTDVVDWVLVSFRTGIAANTEVVKTAALLHKDGRIHFTETCPIPESLLGTDLYAVIDHRNHMVVMSHTAIPMAIASNQPNPNTTLVEMTYDFSQQDSYRTPTSTGQKQLPSGEWVMLAGDMDGNYDINGSDKIIWSQENGVFGQYKSGDLNLNGDVNGSDKAPWESNSGSSTGVPQ